MNRDSYIHVEMGRAGQRAARDWDALSANPGAYHAAALTDLCVDRGLDLSSGCDNTPAASDAKHEGENE